ncbi:DUF1643 domain-containing protein [Clostridium tertium]|uniref:DUF1643 domain-containing protein n=1 Tax=Clostridium tertium TaxID=1559 RepID=UPI001AE146B2|nr:DUF1643 domain-containing protein [Clostridium tertium]MBP1869005.1 hypothetical protein [Clostridium tertium]
MIKYEVDVIIKTEGENRYRYLYEKTWNSTKKYIICILFNPSKADLYFNDNTLDRLVYEFKDEYGGIKVLNLFSIMETKLSDNYNTMKENENFEFIKEYIRENTMSNFFVGWGNSFDDYPEVYINEGKNRKKEIELLFKKLEMKDRVFCYRNNAGKRGLHPSKYRKEWNWKVDKYFKR